MLHFGDGIQPKKPQTFWFWTVQRENSTLQNGLDQCWPTEIPDLAHENSWEHTTTIKCASWCSIHTDLQGTLSLHYDSLFLFLYKSPPLFLSTLTTQLFLSFQMMGTKCRCCHCLDVPNKSVLGGRRSKTSVQFLVLAKELLKWDIHVSWFLLWKYSQKISLQKQDRNICHPFSMAMNHCHCLHFPVFPLES